MSKFSSFIELLVKQTCRRASHEFEMGSRHSSAPLPVIPEHDATGKYSLEFLKALHDRPRDNIYKLLKAPEDLNSVQAPQGVNWLNSNDFSIPERKVLLDFLKKVKNMSPANASKWIDFHHYMHYIYRNFANPSPDPSAETLSPFFISEMKELVNSLLEEDASQVYLRVLALLREYCIFAQWNYTKYDGDHSITRLFYYYESMLSAAKHMSAVFADFEVIIYKNYSVCWIDFNTCVFIRYFFETDYVQNKIRQCLETRVSRGDTPAMFNLLEDLKNLWIREQRRIRKINDDHSLVEGTVPYYIEAAMIGNHKKVLTSNFWVERTQQEKNDLDLRRLDHHFFRLLSDPFFHPAGPILDRNGQRCCCLVELETFHLHINGHAIKEPENIKISPENLSKLISEKMGVEKLGNGSEIPSDLVSTEENDENDSEKVQTTSEEKKPKSRRELELKNTCEIHFSKPQHDLSELNCTKLVFEEFLKHKKESVKKEQLLNKNMRNFIKIKKDIFNPNNAAAGKPGFDGVLKPQNSITKKCEQEITKPKEVQKNGHKCDKPHPPNCKPTVAKSSCEHICRHEEENEEDEYDREQEATNVCQGHVGCDHKESKKCDCTYCEVFGTSVTSHKNNELRDRLRIRLHQRREKRTKDTFKNPPNGNCASGNTNGPVKVKTVVNKVEERVPLPSSPTNIPPAPSVKSSDSSLVTNSKTDDIHGLVNYIEGNTALNKMELAEKKAAKKARQRMKKEEDRRKAEEEQERLAEEQRRKEMEKKKEIARKLAEKEKSKAAAAAAAAQALKELKKKSKKERQAEKKRLAQQGNGKVFKKRDDETIVEETIPAMVTIKRIAESGSSSPTVTITLKGSTPDQDKLLYTLVNGSDDISSNQQTENNGDDAKGKKNKKKSKQNQVQPATVVTKELKVTVALDNNRVEQNSKKVDKNPAKALMESNKAVSKQKESKKIGRQDDLPLPMLRLPPGITITKVEGPVSNRNYPVSNGEDQKGTTINVGKSGVIVVDTEKLSSDKQNVDPAQTKTGNYSKKNKKKKKKMTENQQSVPKQEPPPVIDKNVDSCAPAAIFTNENGMVTIRSSRLQHSLSNGAALNPMPMSMPSLPPDVRKSKANPTPYVPPPVEEKNEVMSPFNAQEILSGLPGIEITKVDKRAVKSDSEINKSCQTAQVSIIPASNGGEKFSFDKDDWLLYDSVFTPRDVLEDDMDAEELELEAFKRFCQQSIPPKRKEKVAHLNVADIVLKKKTDVNFI
ncbi:hypothetical protein JTB14_014283 [Gonioctena quinquepunctata]|nr:hypothetical protein JTB14_014283 [Gonioctena quinquepunctata]